MGGEREVCLQKQIGSGTDEISATRWVKVVFTCFMGNVAMSAVIYFYFTHVEI